MFCPHCGQQQASEEVRFCSRCGLQLDALADFIEHGGRLEAEAGPVEADLLALTPRQRGTRKGLLILVGGLIFGLVAVILTAAKHDFFVLLLPAAILITWGVMRMLYGLLLEDDAARKKAEKRATRDARRETQRAKNRDKLAVAFARDRELPPQRSVPARAFTKAAPPTGEVAPPPSVTENTTRLLEEDVSK